MDKEEGEMSDDNMMLVDNTVEPTSRVGVDRECTVIYKTEKNGLLIGELEKVDAAKLEERAKRFGLNLTGSRVITQRQIDELYSNFGIQSGNERHFRFDTLHLRGVDGLTTKEIFEYLEDYKPVSLEWLDDVSCNIVCQDHISVALALLVHSREINSDKLKTMLFDKSTHWREGMPHPKKDLILMRFATNGDKKVVKKKPEIKSSDYYDQNLDSVSKNPWGDLCQSWGVYDHQEVLHRMKNTYDEEEEEVDITPKIVKIPNKKLAMRLGKRHISKKNSDDSEDSASDSEWKKRSKVPRMRMHADDEESKQKLKQIEFPTKKEALKGDSYAPLCIEVTNSRGQFTPRESTKLSDKFKYHNSHKQSIHSRLGEKMKPTEDWSSENSSDNSDCNVMSKVQKVNNTNKSTNSVWSRLETKSEKSNAPSDLRHILKSKKQKDKPRKSDDLRDRLGKSKQANIRIEIDNK